MLCLVLAQFVYPPDSNAQNAARTPLLTTTPWQKQDDYLETRLSGKLGAEMKKIVGGLAAWAQQAGVDSLGCTPAWCGAYYSNKSNVFPLFKYEMRAGFFTGDMGMLTATPGKEGRFVITANDLSTLQQTFSLNGHDYISLPSMQEVYGGVFYREAVVLEEESGEPRQTRSWLITRAGESPYTILSRKDYLEAAIGEIAADKQKVKEDLQQRIPVKTAQQEEAEQQREIQSIESMYTGATRDSRIRSYKANYKPDSVYFKEVFAGESAALDADSVLLQDMLKKTSPDSLAKPAFVSGPAHAFRHFGDGEPGARMLAKWNMNYFDKTLTLARPQFMVVTWQYDPVNPVAADVDRLIMKLDYCDLQAQFTQAAATAR